MRFAFFVVVALAAGCGGSDGGGDSGAGGSAGAGVGGAGPGGAGGSGGFDCATATDCVVKCACSTGGSIEDCQVACGVTGGTGGGAGAAGAAGSVGGNGASAGEGGASGASGASGEGGTSGIGGASGTSGAAGLGGGLPALGSLVVLGDSIGDGGGQPPFYYDLLRDSLTARYGAITYQRRAKSGSMTGALVGQVDGLPGALPGPVAVCITSGGNDMKDDIVAVATGNDAALVAQMGANVDAALGRLLAPARFGAGVAVHVFEANIYDATDGQGNFNQGGCNVSVPVVLPTDPFFGKWNGEIAARVSAHGQTLADIHGRFYGHGFNNPPNWYAGDCTHPNAVGHDQLRRYFYELITGEALP